MKIKYETNAGGLVSTTIKVKGYMGSSANITGEGRTEKEAISDLIDGLLILVNDLDQENNRLYNSIRKIVNLATKTI